MLHFFKVNLPNRKLLLQFTGAAGLQAIQMAISAVIGFMIIRHLSKDQYAVFNAFALGSTMFVGWAGIGIVSVYIPFANRMGSGRDQLRSTTAVFRKLDSKLAYLAALACLVFWVVSGHQNNWLGSAYIVGMAISLAIGWMQYGYRLPEAAFKVDRQPLLPFSISVRSEILRLCGVVAIVFVIVPLVPGWEPTVLLLATLCSAAWALTCLTRKFKLLPEAPVEVTGEHRLAYKNLLKPLLFPSYFYHSSQFFRSWLIYLISGASVIAEAAALGRLMMLFAMMDKAVELVIIPRFGATEDDSKFLKKLMAGIAVMTGLGLLVVTSAVVLPKLWLWLLGEKYENLGKALLWAVAAASVERVSGLILFAQLSRGASKNQWWVPVFATGTYLGYAAYFGLSTAESATKALFVGAASNLVAQVIILAWHVKHRARPDQQG